MDARMLPKRRHLLRLLAALPLAGRVGQAASAPRPPEDPDAPPRAAGPSILVAGPDGGALDRWGRLLAPAMARFLPQPGGAHVAISGGVDGVTGANHFDARTAPDGNTAMLVPGAAVLAWLAGDPRAQFDVASWVPVLAGVAPGLVAGRVAPADLGAGHRVRIAAATPAGPDLAALLGVHLLGAELAPVFGLSDPASVRDAFARGEVDLVFLHGRNVPDQLAALRAAGARPVFSLDGVGENGAMARDPRAADVAEFAELYAALHGARPAGRLYAAWTAAATAACWEFGLVLPQMTPAAMVSAWRRAGLQATAAPELQQEASEAAILPLAGAGATASGASVAVDGPTLLELRRWLAASFGSRAG